MSQPTIFRTRHASRKPRGRTPLPNWAHAHGTNITRLTFEAAEGRARRGGAGPREALPQRRSQTAEAGPPDGWAEADLLALLDQGAHQAALELLMETQGAVVLAFCLRIVADEALAEDVRQKVFIDAYRGFSTFIGSSSVRTWLLGIAKHRSLDALRSARRELGRTAPEAVLTDVADAADGPGERFESALTRGALQECLERYVSAEDRALILMHYRDELSYEDLGELFGEKADTLRARAARALVRLRRHLRERGVAP